MPWNPGQYGRYSTERAASFDDLLPLIQVLNGPRTREALRVIDLGCGSGELTARLADALPGSAVLGLDSSPEMLQQAAEQARPGLRFELGSIENLPAGHEWDLMVSHSALQWVPEHRRLIPRLIERLAPGGQIAVQMPSNHRHPVHLLLNETAAEEPALGGWTRRSPVLSLLDYAELLHRSGVLQIEAFEKVYPAVLTVDELVEWMKGTGLVPYLERLPDETRRAAFVERYRDKLRAGWPGGIVFYGITRIFFAGMIP